MGEEGNVIAAPWATWINIFLYRHEKLRNYLSLIDYSVYPRELLAAQSWTNPGQDQVKNFGFIDVAAHKDGKYYGFEYKSTGDQVSRAIFQCEAYILSFDYVIVVCERNLTPRSKYWMILEDMGVGIWRVTYTRRVYNGLEQPETLMQITEKLQPKLQNPIPSRLDWVDERFRKYVWHNYRRPRLVIRGRREDNNQRQLTQF